MTREKALQEKSLSFFKHGPAVLLLLVGICLSAGAALKTAAWEQQRMAVEFEKNVDSVMDLLGEEMRTSLDVLLSVRSFFIASNQVEWGEFEKFVKPLIDKHPEIDSVEWIPKISKEERAAFEKRVSEDLRQPYRIHHRHPDGRISEVEDRSFYYPLFYLQPFEPSLDAGLLGQDYASRPGRFAAMKKALEMNQPAMTDMLELYRFKNSRNAFGAMVFLPVLEETQAESGGALKEAGFVSAVYHISEVIEKLSRRAFVSNIALRLYASSIDESRELIYEKASDPDLFESSKKTIEVSSRLELWGKTWVLVFRPEKGFFKEEKKESIFVLVIGFLLTVVGTLYLYSHETSKHRGILRQLSLLDEMTGLYNRRGLEFLAEEQFKLSRRNKTGIALFIADLNHLKQINDRFGHQEGDRAIKAAAHLIRKSFRDSDIVSRIGGDEFAVLAINAEASRLRMMHEKLQAAFSLYNRDRMHDYALTLSAGFSSLSEGEEKSLDELFEEADRALYESKIFKPAFEMNL